MMKKVLYGVALALLACGPVCTLQSCKDDVSDLKTQTSFDLAQLQNDLNGWRTVVNSQIDDLEDRVTANENYIEDHKALIQGLAEKYSDLATMTWVQDKLDELNLVGENSQEYQQLLSDVQTALNGLNNANNNYTNLEPRVKAIEDLLKGKEFVEKSEFNTLVGNFNTLEGRVGLAETQITAVETGLAALAPQVAANTSAIAEINTKLAKLDELETQLNALKADVTTLQGKVTTLEGKVTDLEGKVTALEGEVAELKTEVAELKTKVENLEKQMAFLLKDASQRISAILIQGVNSPVFGDFSLPIGVKSNILFNWYGYNQRGAAVTFPDVNSQFGVVRGVANITGTPKETETLVSGKYYPEVISLGTAYVTVNPLGAEMTDQPIKVVDSQNNELPLELINLKKSSKLLTHGYTRADNLVDAPLYDAEAVIKPNENNAQLEAVRVNINDKLESTFKNVFKDPNYSTAAALLKALYNQMNGMLPAYALRYDWTVTGDTEFSPKSYQVLSQYDLAVATARPLSYNFLAGDSSSKELPTFSAIDNFISDLKNDINIKIDNISLENFDISFGDLEIKVPTEKIKLLILIPNMQVLQIKEDGTKVVVTRTLVLSTPDPDKFDWNTVAGWTEATKGDYEYSQITGLESLNDAISDAIQSALDKAAKNMSDELKKQIQDQINNQVIAKLQNQINNQIKDIIDDLNDKIDPYFNKVNRAFDIYNKIATKVNKILKNPNAYLQVTAAYSMGNGEYGIVSGDPKDYTVYDGTDGFNLYLTSYTGELIVPAYKKYVAVTGVVTDTKTGAVQSIPVDNAINAGDLNTVLDGNRIRVKVPVAGFESGKVYEFTYQAVDYRGYTSTRKFYVQVNKK